MSKEFYDNRLNDSRQIITEDCWDSRTRCLIGEEACNKLAASKVLVVGVGGVGGYAAEMLVRTGVGSITILDSDNVAKSNINRQLIALQNTVGQPKVELFAQRFKSINPNVEIKAVCQYLTADCIDELMTPGYDFVIDAIDTVAPKVALLAYCLNNKIPVISSMGAGGRLDPTKVEYVDLWQTREDGLARAVRQALKKRGIRSRLDVVYSSESPLRKALMELNEENKKSSFGTLATIPAIFGIFLANYVIRKLIKL